MPFVPSRPEKLAQASGIITFCGVLQKQKKNKKQIRRQRQVGRREIARGLGFKSLPVQIFFSLFLFLVVITRAVIGLIVCVCVLVT